MSDDELFDRVETLSDTISAAMCDADFIRNNSEVLAAAIIADSIDRLTTFLKSRDAEARRE